MKIALLTIAEQRKGGFAVAGGAAMFATQLWKALKIEGFEPILFRVTANKNESVGRTFMGGIPFQNVNEALVPQIAREFPTIATYTYWKSRRSFTKLVLELGLPIVLHDPAEMRDEFLSAVRGSSSPIVTIRGTTQRRLEALKIPSMFIPHPYVRADLSCVAPLPPVRGRSVARLDFRKHQEIIVGANSLLPPEAHAEMWGDVNRMFAFHTLDAKHPQWKKWYRGVLPDELGGARAYMTADYAINLTTIKDDGDGTEYATLEAWDAGAISIVHKKWILTGKGELRPGETCLAVGNAGELAALLAVRPYGAAYTAQRAAQLVQLASHAPAPVVGAYRPLLRPKPLRGAAGHHGARIEVGCCMQKPCIVCGQLFETHLNAAKLCSQECRDRRQRKTHLTMRSNGALSTATVGAINELTASADLARQGFDVFRAVSPSASCDLVALKATVSLRIEVRTGRVTVDGKLTWPKEARGRFDHFAVVTWDNGNPCVFYIPALPVV